MSSHQPTEAPIPNGVAIAAYLAAMIGLLVLGLVAFACMASKPFEQSVYGVGKLWMPGASGIGPYSGKETLGLLGWLISWSVLHSALRRRQLRARFWLVIFLVGIGLATTLLWPPV